MVHIPAFCSWPEEATSDLLDLHLHQRPHERAVRVDADVGRVHDALCVVRSNDERRSVDERKDRLDVPDDDLRRRKR